MTRLAIVSSYNDSCGNAAFTRVLKRSIEHSGAVEVEVLELDLALLQSVERRVRRLGDRHIAQLAKRLRDYDAVNIQLESGLYGSLPGDVLKRVRLLLDAHPRTSVTLHAPRLLPASNAGQRAVLKLLLGLRVFAAARQLRHELPGMLLRRMNHKLVALALARGQRLIVHTQRAHDQILNLWPQARVDVHPLKFIPDDFTPAPEPLRALRQQLGLQETDKLIGMFGYISAYKGHLDALDALLQLEPHCKLLIFGRQHPQTIRADGQRDAYLGQLIQAITSQRKLKHRVYFLGELEHERFVHMAATVDACWLPYYENGQDGSGIASICLDVNPRVLCSASFAFDELLRLEPHPNALRFDIGNSLELAHKTAMALRNPAPPLQLDSRYSLDTQAALYTRELD